MSPWLRIGRRTGCEEARLSAPMALLRRPAFSSSPPHSGFHWATILPAIQVAKPSFSQMSSHHFMVT